MEFTPESIQLFRQRLIDNEAQVRREKNAKLIAEILEEQKITRKLLGRAIEIFADVFSESGLSLSAFFDAVSGVVPDVDHQRAADDLWEYMMFYRREEDGCRYEIVEE